MFRILATIGLSLTVGIAGTLLVQTVVQTSVTVTPAMPLVAACPEPPVNPAILQPFDTQYTPQGRPLQMPQLKQEGR